jgi:hypothetical protein
VAEEGNKSEGQESNPVDGSEVSSVPDSVEYLSSVHISTYEQMKEANTAESHLGAMGWAEACSRDERGQIRQSAAVPSSRSWQSRQATYRRGQDWKRTVARARQSVVYSSTSLPREPYAKGEGAIDLWWDRMMTRVFRWLGVS